MRWLWITVAVVAIAACKKATVSVTPDATIQPTRKIHLGPEGVDVEVSGKHLAPGCLAPGPGVTVPKADGGLDEDGLRACMMVLKKTATDNFVELNATSETTYQTLVSALDATREDSARAPLFPEASFGFPKGTKSLNDAPASLPLGTGEEVDGALVIVSKTGLFIDEDRILPIPDDATRGFPPEHKRGGVDGLFVVPLGAALSKRYHQEQQIREATGKKTRSFGVLVADRGTPYRLFFEAFYTLTQSGFSSVRLLVLKK